MNKKVFVFGQTTDIRDELAQPGHDALWRVLSLKIQKIKLKIYKSLGTGLKIAVSNCEWQIPISFETIAF